MKMCSFCKTPVQKSSWGIPQALGYSMYTYWHIQNRVPVESTNRIWYPVSALSSQTWSIRHPLCHSRASLEHLCCWWALTLPGFWPKESPEGWESLTHSQPGCLCLHRALPQPAAAALPGCWDRTRHAWVSWKKGQSALFGIHAAFPCDPLFYRNLSCSWLEKTGLFGLMIFMF